MPSSKQQINIIPETIQALKRLANTLKELDDKGTANELTDGISLDMDHIDDTVKDIFRGGAAVVDQKPLLILPIQSYRNIHKDVVKSYDMMRSAADLIAASCTKFTLVERIKEHDGFKLVVSVFSISLSHSHDRFDNDYLIFCTCTCHL